MAIGKSQQLYTKIWQTLLPVIVETIEKGKDTAYSLNEDCFREASERKSYSFRTEFVEGKCNKCANSAVARDLVDVLESSTKFKQVCKKKQIVIRLSSSFELTVEIR